MAKTPRTRPNVDPGWIDPCFTPSSDLEFRFAHFWVELYPKIDLYSHYRFCEGRRYAFDFAHLPSKTAIEIQGGTRVSGMGHSSGVGIQNDAEKVQLAASMGWLVIPITGEQVDDVRVLEQIKTSILVREEAA